jgi:hypothetical protein
MPSPLIPTVGAEWRSKAIDEMPWTATHEQRPGGESQGFWVKRAGLRGYLNPSKANARDIAVHPRAAHEKIAADLAIDLGLPVPPAILVDGTASGGLVQAAVVSLVLYPEMYKWSQVIATPSALAVASHVLRATRAIWSGIVALDAWLANSDRNNENNVLIGIDANDHDTDFRRFPLSTRPHAGQMDPAGSRREQWLRTQCHVLGKCRTLKCQRVG